ncbi:MAG: DNA repair protein RecO [Deltaproteobacteria bacterium]|nr:DNA repair protein RecO [Deltaproteobacteria bacterium]
MEAHLSPSIIMRVHEFGESDLLIHFFTSDKGRLKGVAKGARRSRKRFVNCLDLFSLSNLEYELKPKGELHFIHSGKLVDAYPGLRHDFSLLSKASYMIELTEILFPLGVPDSRMFEVLEAALSQLAQGIKADLTLIAFELMAMSLGGYGINLEKCCVCGRDYLSEGIAAFKVEKGGIACLKCQHISAVSPQLSPPTVKALKTMQSPSPDVFRLLDWAEDLMEEIKPVLKRHRDYHLGKHLRTADYLE